MSLIENLPESRIKIGLSATEKTEILREILETLVEDGVIKNLEAVLAQLLAREEKGSTGIGNGIAIPHIRTEQVTQIEYTFASSKEGVDFESLDGNPAHILFLLLAPEGTHGPHIKALASLSRILNDSTVRVRLKNAETAGEIRNVLDEREKELV